MQTEFAPTGAPRALPPDDKMLLLRAQTIAAQFDREHATVRREIRDMHARLGPEVADALEQVAANLSPFEKPTRGRAVAAGRAAARVATLIEARFIETHPHLEPSWIRLADVFLAHRRMAAKTPPAGLTYAAPADARTRKRMRSEGWLDAAKAAGITVISSTGFQMATKFTQRMNWMSERFLSQAAERYVREEKEIVQLENEIREMVRDPAAAEKLEPKRARLNAILADTPGQFEDDYKNVRYPPGDLWIAMKGGRADADVSKVPPRERYLNLADAVAKNPRPDFQQHLTLMYQVRRKRRLDYKTALAKYFRGEAPLYLETPEQAFGSLGGWQNRLLQMTAAVNTLTPEFSPQKKDAPRWKKMVGYMGGVANAFSFVNAVSTSAASARAFSYKEIVNRLDTESAQMAAKIYEGAAQAHQLTNAYNKFELMANQMGLTTPQYAGPIGAYQLRMLQSEVNGCAFKSPLQGNFMSGDAIPRLPDGSDFVSEVVVQPAGGGFVSMLPKDQADLFRSNDADRNVWNERYLRQKDALIESATGRLVSLAGENLRQAESRTPQMYADTEMSNYEQMNIVMEEILSERPDLAMKIVNTGLKFAAGKLSGDATEEMVDMPELIDIAQSAKMFLWSIWDGIRGLPGVVAGAVSEMIPWVKIAAIGMSAYDVFMLAMSYGSDPFSAVGIMIAHMCFVGMFEDIRKALAASALFAMFERISGLAGRGLAKVAGWGVSFPGVSWVASIISGIPAKLAYLGSGVLRRLPTRIQDFLPSGLDLLYVGFHAIGMSWGFFNYAYGLSKLFMHALNALWDIGGVIMMLATSPMVLLGPVVGGGVIAGGVAYGLYRFHKRAREVYHDAKNVAPSIGHVLIERPDLTLNAIRFVGFLAVSASFSFDPQNPVMRAIFQPFEEGSIALRSVSRYVRSALFGATDIIVSPDAFDPGLVDFMQTGDDPIARQLRPLYRAAIDKYGEGAFNLLVCKTWEFVAKQREELRDAKIFETCILRHVSRNFMPPDKQ